MLQDQYSQLLRAAEENAYMSIAVNRDGSPVSGGFIPWERTVSAFNMRMPKLTVAAYDLEDESVMSALKKCVLTGCYIYTELDDYRFIGEFGKLQDLFILHGRQIRDLSFLKGLNDLFMFYIEDASIPDLKPLVDACNKGAGLPGKCFGFRNCRVTDTSSLLDIQFVLSELLVWPAEDDSQERWQTGKKPGVFRFYSR